MKPERKHYKNDIEWLKANCDWLNARGHGDRFGITDTAYQIYLRGYDDRGVAAFVLLRGINAKGDARARSRKWKGQYHHWLEYLKIKGYVCDSSLSSRISR